MRSHSSPVMPDGTAGFTLIEVLVALLLITLAASATATGMRATTNLLGMNERHARAITLTQSAIEDLRTLDYDSIASGSSSTNDGYLTQWAVQSNSPGAGMKFITATTTWNWRGKPQAYRLHTVYSRVTPN